MSTVRKVRIGLALASFSLYGPVLALIPMGDAATGIEARIKNLVDNSPLSALSNKHEDGPIIPTATTTATTRRIWLQRVAGTTMAFSHPVTAASVQLLPTTADKVLSPAAAADQTYLWPLTPPIFSRATYRYNLGRGMYALEQLLAFQNVTTTIRTTVVTLSNTKGNDDDDHLWIHSPQWPTPEYCRLLDGIPGTVRHVVLPCTALEHKAPMKAFCRRYPHAAVWIAPGQYGPFGSCGRQWDEQTSSTMGYRVDGILGDSSSPLPDWMNEFQLSTLYIDLPDNAGPVSEVAFCHRPTRTLVVTDAVQFIPEQATTDIYATYFGEEAVKDPTFWPRTVLQANFLPLRSVPSSSSPLSDDQVKYPGFVALQNRLIRSPVLRAFIDARAPDEVRAWVDEIVSTMTFDHIVASHFASPIQANPRDVARTFAYLQNGKDGNSIDCQDWQPLRELGDFIEANKLGAPQQFDFTLGCLSES